MVALQPLGQEWLDQQYSRSSFRPTISLDEARERSLDKA
jgi:hypothetical protein